MNEATNKVEDRFHNPLKVSYGTQPKPQPCKGLRMIYCPQGIQIVKAKQDGCKLTEDKAYDVLERANYRIKVVDDSGDERWVKEDYFTLANQNLLYEKDCNWQSKGPKEPHNTLNLQPHNGSMEVPDVRKIKFKKEPDEQLYMDNDTKSLAGVSGFDYHTYKGDPVLVTLSSQEEVFLEKEAVETFVKNRQGPAYIPEVKENSLLENLDKLWERLGNVFPEYKKVDSDGLMDYISSKLPNRKLNWKNGLLHVDGCATNINKIDVGVAFDGLKKLTTPKIADKLVGKVIVNKLQKLF